MTAGSDAGEDPALRQFDFWLGEWEVRRMDGALAGHNRIERTCDGRVLHERYRTDHGFRGESLNIYDATRKLWHQSWVDSTGTLLLLEGGLVDGNMVLSGQLVDDEGSAVPQRITWTPNADGSVRQLWESADASGAWSVVFDGRYTRK
jgi:hypothetical protein